MVQSMRNKEGPKLHGFYFQWIINLTVIIIIQCFIHSTDDKRHCKSELEVLPSAETVQPMLVISKSWWWVTAVCLSTCASQLRSSKELSGSIWVSITRKGLSYEMVMQVFSHSPVPQKDWGLKFGYDKCTSVHKPSAVFSFCLYIENGNTSKAPWIWICSQGLRRLEAHPYHRWSSVTQNTCHQNMVQCFIISAFPYIYEELCS